MVESLADLGHSMLNEDKFTSRHNITSDATCFQLRQTLDILRQHRHEIRQENTTKPRSSSTARQYQENRSVSLNEVQRWHKIQCLYENPTSTSNNFRDYRFNNFKRYPTK